MFSKNQKVANLVEKNTYNIFYKYTEKFEVLKTLAAPYWVYLNIILILMAFACNPNPVS